MLHKSQHKIYEPELSGTLHGFAYGQLRLSPSLSLDLTLSNYILKLFPLITTPFELLS